MTPNFKYLRRRAGALAEKPHKNDLTNVDLRSVAEALEAALRYIDHSWEANDARNRRQQEGIDDLIEIEYKLKRIDIKTQAARERRRAR